MPRSLRLIERLLRKGVSETLREDLTEMKRNIADGSSTAGPPLYPRARARGWAWWSHRPAATLRLEIHRHAVDAVAQAGRRRAVVEDVAEMAAAAAAMHLGAHHAVAAVLRWSSTAPATGSLKLGQPVPLSNFFFDLNSGWSQPAQTNVPGRFS